MAIHKHPPENYVPDDRAGEKLADKQRAPLDEMPFGSFTSSNVHSGLYDFEARECYLRYLRSGERDAIYRYDDFPASEWNGLVNAASKGSYVNANIAFEYRYTLLTTSDVPEEGRSARDHRVRRFVTTP